jgi:hypothetical protein
MRRQAGFWTFLVAAILAAPWTPGAEPPPAAGAPSAAEAVSANLDVEKTLQREDRQRYEKLSTQRAEVTAELVDLYGDLDAAVRREDGSGAQQIEDLLNRVEAAERDRGQILDLQRVIVDRMRERARRIGLLDERLASLQARVTEAAGPLSARWDVVLLPLNQRGTFSLLQNGTLISGTYTLDGGWTGSLQGTCVNRKVYLQRIDSKLGRSAEFEGYLSADGTQIRGTWTSYDVSGQGASNGQWSAVRRP